MKSKLIKLFAVAMLATGVVACSSNTVNMEPVALEELDPNECYFDGTDRKAAAWTCGFPVEGYPITGVGTFRQTNAGTSFARAQAEMAARIQIANNMKVKIGNMVKNYAATTGVADDETVDAAASSTSKQITAETLYGTKVLRYLKSPNGTTYALVTMDEVQAMEVAKQAAMTSYKNNRAQWQRFMADKSHTELEREMDKMVQSEFQAFNAETSQ